MTRPRGCGGACRVEPPADLSDVHPYGRQRPVLRVTRRASISRCVVDLRLSAGAGRSTRSRGRRRAASPGPNGSSPRSPIRRVASSTSASTAWTTKPAAAPSTSTPAQPAEVEAQEGGEFDVAHAQAARGDQRQEEEDDEQHDGAQPGAQQRRPVARWRARRRSAGAAPTPMAGSTTRLGSSWCCTSMTVEQHARRRPGTRNAGSSHDSPNRTPVSANSTAVPSSTSGGRTASRCPPPADHGNRPASRFTRWPTPSPSTPATSAVRTADTADTLTQRRSPARDPGG